VTETIPGQIEDRHPISNWGHNRITIWSEDEVSFSVDGAQEIRELLIDQRVALSRESKESREAP
jgi:hypothetical protein